MTPTKEKTKITKAKFPRPRVDVALKQTESKEDEILCLEKATEDATAESKKEREEKKEEITLCIYIPPCLHLRIHNLRLPAIVRGTCQCTSGVTYR